MNILKSITVSLFSFLLFIAILLFGYFYLVKSTVMNPDYLTERINEIEAVEIIDEFIEFEGSPETEQTIEQIREIAPELEPVIKERLNVAIYSFYDYILGKKQEPEIKPTLGESFLNPGFVEDALAVISLPDIIDNMLSTQSGEDGLSEELIDAVKTVVADLEPDIKEQVVEISGPVFDYILDESPDLDLSAVLRDTILSEDFVVPVLEKLDLAALAQEFISDQLAGQIPSEMEFLTEYIDDAVKAIEPAIKSELTDAAEPILDYLVGDTSHISIQISLAPVVESLEDNLKDTLLANPPAEYSDLSRSELSDLFDEVIGGRLAEILPETFEIDESIIGPEIPGNIAGGIADAEQTIIDIRDEIDNALIEIEEPLETTRKYVSYFQLAFTLLIVFIGLMVLGIILVLRDVRAICRRIGVPLLIYGAIEYAAIWAGRYFLDGKIAIPDIPPGVESMIYDLSNSVMRPLEIFSLCLLIIGLVLTVISFVYKRGQKEQEAEVIE